MASPTDIRKGKVILYNGTPHLVLDMQHRTQGRQYVYRLLVSRNEARRSRLAQVVEQFFRGNPADLVYHLLDKSEVDDEDLGRILALIEAKERERDNDGE